MLSCLDCDFQFTSQNDLKEHIRYRHGIKPSTCKICGYHVNTESEMIEHNNRYHARRFECLECGNKFDRKSQLERHREWYHYESYHTRFDRRNNHRRSEVICNDCGKVFYNKHDMMIHKRREHVQSDKSPIPPLFPNLLTGNRFDPLSFQGNWRRE